MKQVAMRILLFLLAISSGAAQDDAAVEETAPEQPGSVRPHVPRLRVGHRRDNLQHVPQLKVVRRLDSFLRPARVPQHRVLARDPASTAARSRMRSAPAPDSGPPCPTATGCVADTMSTSDAECGSPRQHYEQGIKL